MPLVQPHSPFATPFVWRQGWWFQTKNIIHPLSSVLFLLWDFRISLRVFSCFFPDSKPRFSNEKPAPLSPSPRRRNWFPGRLGVSMAPFRPTNASNVLPRCRCCNQLAPWRWRWWTSVGCPGRLTQRGSVMASMLKKATSCQIDMACTGMMISYDLHKTCHFSSNCQHVTSAFPPQEEQRLDGSIPEPLHAGQTCAARATL